MPNRRYLCLHRRASGERQQPSAAQMQDMQAVFKAWMEKYKANILDVGGPLKPGGKILTGSGVTDGPFAEAKEIIGGYMLVTADSYERALEITRESPALMMPGASVEVREVAAP
ncbi:MAG: YciI family protein [Gemmatimonadota bacterium]|nr:YciI family protein [Gemmatimonadota bacterium]